MKTFLVILLTFAVSMVPIIELKGSIPMGVALAAHYGFTLSPWAYFGAAIIGSALPAIPMLLFLVPALKKLGTKKHFSKFANWLENRFQKKAIKVETKIQAKADAAKLKAESEGVEYDEATLEKLRKSRELRVLWAKIISIFFFVAIPIPGTGVWTGSAIAAFMGVKFKYAYPAVILGNIVAGLIIMLVTLLVGSQLFGISFV